MAKLSAYNYCLYLLSKREHSVVQITQKLKLRETDEVDIENCLAKLQANKLQCDDRFCESMIRYYSGQLKGEQWIKHALKQAGIESYKIENAFMQADVNWLENLEKLIHKKYGEIECLDFQEKQKRQRYLLTKGFTYSQINEVTS